MTVTKDDTGNSSALIALIQQESKQWEREDRGVLSALKKLGSQALQGDDALIVARNIYAEFPRLKAALKAKNRTIGDFCKKAKISSGEDYSRELHRLMLAPGADPTKIRPRKSASKYLWLIEAMSDALGESVSSFTERMLRGTTLHSADNGERSEVEMIQATLQRLVDKLDQEFGLHRTYLDTAQVKARHAANGGDCRWPQYDGSFRRNFYGETEDHPENAERELSGAMDIRRAYWERPITKRVKTFESFTYGPTPSGCLQDDSFFHVPHCHLGHAAGLNEPLPVNATPQQMEAIKTSVRAETLRCLTQYGDAPKDDWDEVNERPVGQTSSMPHAAAHDHAWLIIYPSPDHSGVMPMIYIAVEECGPIIVPLDAVTLSAMRRMYWVEDDQTVITWLDHIKRLLLADAGRGILDRLRRTAPWLAQNPLLKMERQYSRDMAALKALYTSLGNDTQTIH